MDEHLIYRAVITGWETSHLAELQAALAVELELRGLHVAAAQARAAAEELAPRTPPVRCVVGG